MITYVSIYRLSAIIHLPSKRQKLHMQVKSHIECQSLSKIDHVIGKGK